MAQKIGERELALKAMTEKGKKSAVAPKVGTSKPVKAWRDMTDAERAEHMKDPQGIAARAAENSMAGADAPKPSPAPTEASAQPEKPTMAKKAKAKKTKAKRPRAKSKAAKASVKRSAPVDGENKTGIVLTMLQSPKGCTAAEVCKATGWAAVSIPPIAKRAKLKLRKETEGRGVRYFATPA